MSDAESNQSHELVAQAQNGDHRAFGKLVELHHGHVYGQILRMVRNPEDAKEIAQLAWVKAWRKIDTFRFESAFSSWLYRVATFTALDAIRKRNSRNEVSMDDEDNGYRADQSSSVVALPEQLRTLEQKEIKTRFLEALEELPEHHKTALMLRENEGLSYKEIAKRTNCKPGTVMSRIFNARKAIQSHMKEFLK